MRFLDHRARCCKKKKARGKHFSQFLSLVKLNSNSTLDSLFWAFCGLCERKPKGARRVHRDLFPVPVPLTVSESASSIKQTNNGTPQDSHRVHRGRPHSECHPQKATERSPEKGNGACGPVWCRRGPTGVLLGPHGGVLQSKPGQAPEATSRNFRRRI
jgi:hypothetical protein